MVRQALAAPRVAVVPAAGLGTRLLPATLAVDKELLPLGRYPALCAVLLEALGAGIETLWIVTSPGKDGIRRFLDPDCWPPSLRDAAGPPALDALREMLLGLRIGFVMQPEPLGALDAVERGLGQAPSGQPCPVLYPDLIHLPDQRALQTLLAAHAACQQTTFGLYVAGSGPPAAFVTHGPSARVVLDGAPAEPGQPVRIARVEAGSGPASPGEVRTTFGYVHTESCSEALSRTARPAPGAPLQDRFLLDSLNLLCAAGQLYGTLLPGEVLDLGTPPGYFLAARRFASGEAGFRGLVK